MLSYGVFMNMFSKKMLNGTKNKLYNYPEKRRKAPEFIHNVIKLRKIKRASEKFQCH